ncbi:hypothetical protein NBRC10512_000451 [Rhodotorula toruloides]|uniref:RHTO0S04e10418g1_1 n=2 Tax=Rhodotorula toruloides TaxID=5286 RepID=A0A061AQC2_RHOTO|nr:uncharacterized protein RHTO_05164 [Rhodotorula toruloides NP11]EMS19217.1 hypothetical protein RHTO_05164 [Rhodotorula toruloides NP11]CDR39833.1 RHTO0S04e10418g1_1 [Rhodotorula toruloides]
MPTLQKVARLEIRAAVRQIFSDLTGFALGKDGHILAPELAKAEDQLSADAKNLSAWARCIFVVFAVGSPEYDSDPLKTFRRQLELAAEEVRRSLRTGQPSQDVIRWILSEYSLKELQNETGIPVYDVSQEEKHLAAAPQTGNPHHHGVSLPPPQVPPASQHHTGLPPMLAGVTSPVLTPSSIRLPRMLTREEQEKHQQQDHSLSKRRHDHANFGYGLGSSMTARKAAIYGTTPEEWEARSARRF